MSGAKAIHHPARGKSERAHIYINVAVSLGDSIGVVLACDWLQV